jgi:hypothetical protein
MSYRAHRGRPEKWDYQIKSRLAVGEGVAGREA